MNEPLVLREYESRSFPITRQQAEALREASGGRLKVGIGASGSGYELTADSYVGAVVAADISVLIQPKVPLHNLFLLLGVAPPDFSSAAFRFDVDTDLLVVMATVFERCVDEATMRGVHRGYRATEDRLLSPRGRIDLTRQIKQPAIVAPIACRFDEYTADVFANRVLLAAIDRIGQLPTLPPSLRRSIRRLRQRFDDVAHVQIEPADIDRWQPTRVDQHYERAMRLAAIVLRNLSLANRQGGVASASFLVDMNTLFQQFISERLRRALRPRLELVEEPPVALARPRRLIMRPDLVVRRGENDIYVGDVKYKLSSGPGRMNDYYQLLAYTTAMSLPTGVLIYAQDPGDGADPIGDELVHSVRIRNTRTDIHVYRVPLTGSNVELEQAVVALAAWLCAQCGPRDAATAA